MQSWAKGHLEKAHDNIIADLSLYGGRSSAYFLGVNAFDSVFA